MNSLPNQDLTNRDLLRNIVEGIDGSPIYAPLLVKASEAKMRPTLAGRDVIHLREPEIVPQEKWSTLLETVKEWKKTSLAKIRSIFFDELKLPKTQWSAYLQSARPKRFGDHLMICEGIEQMLNEKINRKEPHNDMEKWDRVFVVFDTSNNPQSIALYDSAANHLSCLVTHPDNLQDPTNQHQVRGTAKKIMTFLIEFSNFTNTNCTLSSTGTARSFYQHLGFEKDRTIPIIEGMPIPMIYKVSEQSRAAS